MTAEGATQTRAHCTVARRPVRIDEVRFYGFGWGFDAMMDDCRLIVEQ